jgi:predicted nucleic acid-binding Zn ribbon protein
MTLPSLNMERASKLIRTMRLPADTITAEDLARAAWADAVGKKIAEHTRPARMVRARLVVEVEDRIWQRQLFALSKQILSNLEKRVGAGIVDDLEFRIVPGCTVNRLPPRRAAHSAGAIADEADRISDPILRGIYKASRQRAGA